MKVTHALRLRVPPSLTLVGALVVGLTLAGSCSPARSDGEADSAAKTPVTVRSEVSVSLRFDAPLEVTEVESLIVSELEQLVNGLEGRELSESTSRAGSALLRVRLPLGERRALVDQLARDLRGALAEGDQVDVLPHWKEDELGLLLLTAAEPGDLHDLAGRAEDLLVSSGARTWVLGRPTPVIEVQLDEHKVRATRVDVGDVRGAIRECALPWTSIGDVRVEELSDVVVAYHDDILLRLRDLAVVSRTQRFEGVRFSATGRPAVCVLVALDRAATAGKVRQALGEQDWGPNAWLYLDADQLRAGARLSVELPLGITQEETASTLAPLSEKFAQVAGTSVCVEAYGAGSIQDALATGPRPEAAALWVFPERGHSLPPLDQLTGVVANQPVIRSCVRDVWIPLRSDIDLIVECEDLEWISEVAHQVAAAVSAIVAVRIIDDGLPAPAAPEIRLRPDPDKLLAFGLDLDEVTRLVSAALRGGPPGASIPLGPRSRIEVRYMDPYPSDLASLDGLEELVVNPASPTPIRLMDIATLEQIQSPFEIVRGTRRRARIQLRVEEQPSEELLTDLRERCSAIVLPPGVDLWLECPPGKRRR
ncbi:MAG: hypothetical protein O2816_17890 [Planctomycetota bacterium]|nr:hypothetical protein [Planctomycetota bacterium]